MSFSLLLPVDWNRDTTLELELSLVTPETPGGKENCGALGLTTRAFGSVPAAVYCLYSLCEKNKTLIVSAALFWLLLQLSALVKIYRQRHCFSCLNPSTVCVSTVRQT